MKRFIICLLFSLLQLSLSAQSTLSGIILDEKGEALPGANIYLDGTYDGCTSGLDGTFTFSSQESGDLVLKVDFIGYKSFSQNISLPGEISDLKVQLEEAFTELKAVAITAGAFEASDAKKAVILTSLDMVTTAGTAGDVYGALQTLPGTATVGESGQLFVRGGNANESQTFIDGSLVHQPYQSTAPATPTRGRYNPFMFNGTVFSTGGYSAEYGNALSAVLLLDTKGVPAEDQLDIGILSVGGDLAGTKTWKDGGITANVNYTNLGPYMSLVPQNFTWNQAPEALGSSLSIRQKTGKSGLFKLYGNFSRSGFNLEQEDPNAALERNTYDLSNDNLYLNASWKSLLNANWSVKTGVSFSMGTDEVGLAEGNFTSGLKGLHSKSVLTRQLTEKIKIRAGGEYQRREYEEIFSTENEEFANRYSDNLLAGFMEADIFASKKFVTRLGTRMDYSGRSNQAQFSPRLSTAYKLSEKSQLSLAYGWFYQNPTDNFQLYTDQLNPERADHLMLNYQMTDQRRTLRAEAYYKNYRDLVKFTDQPFYLPEGYTNQGEGYAYGVDFFFRDKKTIKNGDYWVSYSFVESQRNSRDFPEMATPSYVSRHNFSFVYKHWFGGIRSMAGMTFQYGSPRNFNDPNQDGFNSSTMPAYKTLDLNWSFLYRENIIFHAAVSNVPGFKQEFGRRFASQPGPDGNFQSVAVRPPAKRFIVLACFITLSPNKDKNQLKTIQ